MNNKRCSTYSVVTKHTCVKAVLDMYPCMCPAQSLHACRDASCQKRFIYLRGSVSELVTAAYVHASLGPVTAGSHLPALPPLEPGEGEGGQAAVHHAPHMEGLQCLTQIVQGSHLHAHYTIRHIMAAVMYGLCRAPVTGGGRGGGGGAGAGAGAGRGAGAGAGAGRGRGIMAQFCVGHSRLLRHAATKAWVDVGRCPLSQ